MKKVAFMLASLIAIMLAGCGSGSSSTGNVAGDGSSSNTNPVVEVEASVDADSAKVTTPDTPYNLSAAIGSTPPGLPE